MKQKSADLLKQIPTEIADLENLTRTELVAAYKRIYRYPPPAYAHPKLLSLAIAHRCQEQVSGGRDRALEGRLQRLAEKLRTTGSLPVPSRPPVKSGTRLLREWEGETHTVTVAEQGFLYRDKKYGSLSAIAREITGTRWSGPKFFGLKERGISP